MPLSFSLPPHTFMACVSPVLPLSRYYSSSWPVSKLIVIAIYLVSFKIVQHHGRIHPRQRELRQYSASSLSNLRCYSIFAAVLLSNPSTKQARRRRFVISAPVNLTVVAVEFIHANANCVNTPRHRSRISAATYCLIHYW